MKNQKGIYRGGRLRKEWGIAIFALLMATALPALAAILVGAAVFREAENDWEDTTVCILRHGTEEESESEVLALSRILALSLAATNPSDAPAESLAAQAVILRSRAIWWMDYCKMEDASEAQSETEHPTLCDSPSHGLPYLSAGELATEYGSDEAAKRIAAGEQAVEKTGGQVLCYEGEVIPALMHYSSPGRTRSAAELNWLSAVSTPETGKVQEIVLSAEKTRLCLATNFGVSLAENPIDWEIIPHANEAGWVESVTVEGTEWNGNVFAEALSLPSSCFTIRIEEDEIKFTVMGEGSGCGLSREGAAIYAEGGLGWREILAHYFPKCTVEELNGKEVDSDQ